MKKIILVLILFVSCYIIYSWNYDDKYNYLVLGDSISLGTSKYVKEFLNDNKMLKSFNDVYTDSNYRISDIIRMIKYNETKTINGIEYNINKLIKEADVITISLGMNELYFKFNNNDINVYSYMNDVLREMEELLKLINRFEHKMVIILGYYDVMGKINEVNYINVMLENMVTTNNNIYISLSNLFNNNPNMLSKNDNYIPNNYGYLKISQIIVEKIKNN